MKRRGPGNLFHASQSTCRLMVLAVLMLASGASAANSKTLDAAVKQYYAGRPDTAIAMIEPLATAGDADAQYLLGNLLYTLAQANQPAGDPAPWYRRAAAQGSAAAAYALGTLYQNRWLQSRRDDDAEQARAAYQRALELGDGNARAALDKLAAHRRSVADSKSLTYTNDSFSSTRSVEEKPAQPVAQTAPAERHREAPPVTTLDELLANFESSGDPVADAERLKELLGRMDQQALAGPGGDSGVSGGLFGNFESAGDLLGKLIELYGHIETATELSTAPGAN